MSRRGDPVRIETARREATIARLVSDGHSIEDAGRLVATFEATREASGGPLDRAGWEGFDRWLADRRADGANHGSRGSRRVGTGIAPGTDRPGMTMPHEPYVVSMQVGASGPGPPSDTGAGVTVRKGPSPNG